MIPGEQQVLFLENVQKFAVRERPLPVTGDSEVLIEVGAVGICGTDLHIFHGLANYCRDARGVAIPLSEKPQVLGHEFCGRVVAVGKAVTRCKVSDFVAADQFLSCVSLGRTPRCEYCVTGDSHQCEFGQEMGINGPPGAFRQFVSVPESNVLVLPADFDVASGALIEPLGCVIHACDRLRHAAARYSFDGPRRIRRMAVLGAGPSGLLFIQCLRNLLNFDGDLFAADLQESKLELAAKFGATPINVKEKNLLSEVRDKSSGTKLDCMIEATGSGSVFDAMPLLLRSQASVLFYGAGHSGRDVGCLTSLQVSEIGLITTAGASGGFDADGPTTYNAAMRAIKSGKVDVQSLITHRYQQFGELQQAFSQDFQRPEFVKGILIHTAN